jgi:hypothetical protein
LAKFAQLSHHRKSVVCGAGIVALKYKSKHMRQRLYQVLFVIICVGTVQIGLAITGNTVMTSKKLHGSSALLFSGSPYFTDEYKYANILLTSGRVFASVKMRIDLATQQAFIVTVNGIEANMGGGMVKEITYADTTAETGIISYKFQTGFPAVDKQTKNNFYLVLAEGRCSFLKLILKKASERKNDLMNTVTLDYETFEDYYIFSKGVMRRWKKDKEFVLAELADKQAEVNAFVLANKTNFKNQESLLKLLTYYNSLH